MAAITFNGAHQTERARRHLKVVLAACRRMLDGIVSGLMREAAAEAEHARPRPGNEQTETAASRLVRPDSSVLSEAIPAFFIGRNQAGLWVAREANGRTGGIFLLKRSALAFARAEAGPAGCAVIFLSQRFELDLKNDGNPLAAFLASIIQGAGGKSKDPKPETEYKDSQT